LEPKNIFKILSLNKEVRANFLGNLDCYDHIKEVYFEQIKNLKSALTQKHSVIQQQERSIRFLKESDELRNQLMN
jgi:hypothetical protein